MLGFRYIQSTPTTYLIQFRNGVAVRRGAGIAFWYFKPRSVIVRINLAAEDVPFVFELQTADFQEVTVQGNLTYRVIEPDRLASKMDFSIQSGGRYASDDPDAMRDRLVRLMQIEATEFVRGRTLTEVLPSATRLAEQLQVRAAESPLPTSLGLTIDSVVLLSIKATPEMESALQAEAREATLQKADAAVHARRVLAIAAEQQIRERELENERVITEQQRAVRQSQVEADVAIERERQELVTQQAENEKTLSAVRIDTLRQTVEAMGRVDWKTIAASSDQTDAKQLIALAFGELAGSAEKIGRLDISPDLLSRLMDDDSN